MMQLLVQLDTKGQLLELSVLIIYVYCRGTEIPEACAALDKVASGGPSPPSAIL